MSKQSTVHKDLEVQYRRYKILGIALIIAAFVPGLTLAGLYVTGPGIGYMKEHMLVVAVAFALNIPLLLVLAYVLAFKRMKFLERSTALVARGITKEVPLAGIYKLQGREENLCCVDLFSGEDGSLQRHYVIPNESIKSFVDGLPEAPPESLEERRIAGEHYITAYLETDSDEPVALSDGVHLLWLSPPTSVSAL